MPRPAITVALTAALIFLIATVSLISSYTPGSILWTVWGQPETGLDSNDTLDSKNSRGDRYLLGVGKADITGPVVEINFMGYADPGQLGSGLRQRLYSRAFIVGDVQKPSDRFVYLVLDTQSGDTAIRHGILEGLEALGSQYAMYGEQNVAVTGTHSHSGPGAWLNYLLPQITSRGFNKQSYEAIVDGCIKSITRAHESLSPGRLTIASADVMDANINRSPYAYLANPVDERSRYEHNVDKTMTVLKFHRDDDDKDIGVLTWFPVHGTAMLGNNTIVTGDNKGVAATLFEQYAKDQTSAASDLVAGFSQANVGDTSPNIMGAYCESGVDEGQQCDFKTSLCGGKNGPCHGRGPHWGLNDAGTASAYAIGERQYLGARSIYESNLQDEISARPLTGGSLVRSLHVYTDFANRTFILPNGTSARTCPAALGYSFAAGTTDGPGAFDFKQHNPGDPDANPLWGTVRNRLHEPGPDQIECHGQKPILLDVGETVSPYLWTPNIVDIQLLRVGPLFIIVSPGEATTMAGRRWKESLALSAAQMLPELQGLDEHKTGQQDPIVVLGGPANSYTHYIATAEEYDIQRYEGASTLYGPHTLAAYINLTSTFLPYLSHSSASSLNSDIPPSDSSLPTLDPGPNPPIHTNSSLNFITPVLKDTSPFFRSFGDVLDDVRPTYTLASASVPPPTITAIFVGANPRNNLRLEETFAAIEMYDAHTSAWTRVRDDSDWSLLFEWKRTSSAIGTSEVKISWELGWEVGIWGRRDEGEIQDQKQSSKEVTTGNEVAADDKGHLRNKIRKRDEEEKRVRFERLKGKYRIRYYGDSKALLSGAITPFEGLSGEFEIV